MSSNISGQSRPALAAKTVLFVVSVLLLAAPPSPLKAADGIELLAKIGVTAVEKSYSGQKMVIDFSSLTPQVTKLSIMYQPGGKERREYHASRGLVVIDGDYFYQYMPRKKIVIKRKLPGEGGYDALRQESLKQTLVSYELNNHSADPIAGRETRLYEFRPRQEGSRPLRKIWVDVETGLVLRMEIYSPDSKLFWLSVFENINYKNQVSPASFTMNIPAGAKVIESEEGRCLSTDEAEEVSGVPLVLPSYLPGGFVQKCLRAKGSRNYGEIQVLYSDGLSLMSLFASSRTPSDEGSGKAPPKEVAVGEREGQLQSRGLVTALTWSMPWAHLAIFGEVSRDELLKVAGSILQSRELSRP